MHVSVCRNGCVTVALHTSSRIIIEHFFYKIILHLARMWELNDLYVYQFYFLAFVIEIAHEITLEMA